MACGSMRFIIFLMLCVLAMISNLVRGQMSLAILAMVMPLSNTTAEVADYGPRYAWSAYDQSLVIGSFFCGQVVVITFAGILSERYGARRITGFGIIVAAILTVLAPVSANVFWLLIIVNFLIGLMAGTIPPASQALISRWAPPEEKGKFQSALLANGFGVVINWTMSGFIIKTFGWHYAFYAVGIILAIYSAVWFYIVHDSPIDHPKITDKEKQFIMSKLKTTTTKSKKPWPPIKSIFSSVPFWALMIYHFGNLYASFFFITAAPKYLSEVHHLPISKIGVLSSIPFLIRFPFAIGFGYAGDFVLKKTSKPADVRKGFSVFSHFIPAFCLIGLTFVGNDPYMCVTLITIALGSSSAVSVTSVQNPHDLSPNYCTTVFSFIHTVATSTGFLAPMVVAHFTKERNTEDEWWYIFFIAACILSISAIIFLLFGSVRIQKWNQIKEKDVTEDKEAQVLVERPKIVK